MRTQGARNPKNLHRKSHQISEAEAVLPKEKGFVKHCLNTDTHLKAGSGTCNVCAAPCSSCLHFNRAVSVMESKAEGGSPKNSNGGKDADLCSFSTVDLQPAYKSRTFIDQVQPASETSNLFSATSTHDSFSENADSKATVRTSETHDTSEGVDMPLKVAAFEAVEEQLTLKQHNVSFQAPHKPTNTNLLQKTFVKHRKDSHGLECHGENILCVNGSRNENVAASDIQPNLGKKDMPYSSTSTTALLAQCLKLAGQAQVKDGAIEDCADLETLEDDVEVCDICGDVGREDLLAICSRCNDGAEHIGSFDVKKGGRLPELFEGIQAHLSTHASPRVLEVVTKFPDKIQLEEVSRLSTWPLQFQENSPTEENIALFFFAKDVTSYEKSYSSLLENMMNNDLALTGNLNGVELLIFPSSKLPEKSQRWNQLFFLWGVFRERRANCLQPLSGSQSKSCLPNFNVEHMVQALPTNLLSEVVSNREIPCKEINEVISSHDKSTNMLASDSSKFSSLGPNGRLCYMGGSVGQRNSNQGTTESKFLVGTNAACSVAATDSLTSKSELSRSLDIFLDSRTNNGNSLLCLEAIDNSGTCQKEFIVASDIGRVQLPVNIQIGCTQIDHQQASNRILPTYLITSDPEPPKFSVNLQDAQDVSSGSSVKHQQLSLCVPTSGAVIDSKGEEKMKYTARLMERGTASDSDTTVDKTEVIRQVSEHLNRKRAHSYSPEPVSQFFNETSTGSSAQMLQKERVYISLDEEREEKKMKVYLEAPACNTSGVDTYLKKISYKVQPHLPGFLNELPHSEKFHSGPTVPGNPGSSRRYNFSLDSGSVMDVKSGNLIPLEIVSSDDEDNQESHVPNLELGSGGDKKAVKRETLSLFLPLVDDESRNQEMSDPATQDGDDESSLSLSLAFSFSDKEQMKQPVPTMEQLQNVRSRVSTSLIGDLTDC